MFGGGGGQAPPGGFSAFGAQGGASPFAQAQAPAAFGGAGRGGGRSGGHIPTQGGFGSAPVEGAAGVFAGAPGGATGVVPGSVGTGGGSRRGGRGRGARAEGAQAQTKAPDGRRQGRGQGSRGIAHVVEEHDSTGDHTAAQMQAERRTALANQVGFVGGGGGGVGKQGVKNLPKPRGTAGAGGRGRGHDGTDGGRTGRGEGRGGRGGRSAGSQSRSRGQGAARNADSAENFKPDPPAATAADEGEEEEEEEEEEEVDLEAIKRAALANQHGFAGEGGGGFGGGVSAFGGRPSATTPPAHTQVKRADDGGGVDARAAATAAFSRTGNMAAAGNDAGRKASRAQRFMGDLGAVDAKLSSSLVPGISASYAREASGPPPGGDRQEDMDDLIGGGGGGYLGSGRHIVGTCELMCPESERALRERKEDLEIFERVSPENRGVSDPSLCVKKYTRIVDDVTPDMVRTRAALAKSSGYLYRLLDNRPETFMMKSKFLWDRLRSVRQDLSLQAITDAFAVRLLEQMARYAILSEHELCEECAGLQNPDGHNSHLNIEQLTKTLTSLRHMYDDHAQRGEHIPNSAEAEMFAYQLLLRIDSHGRYHVEKKEALNDLRGARPGVLSSPQVRFALECHRAYHAGNYVRFFRLVRERATYLQACVLHKYFTRVRSRALETMNSTFSKQAVQLSELARLLHTDEEEVELLAVHHGLTVSRQGGAAPFLVLRGTTFVDPAEEFPLTRSPLVDAKRGPTYLGEIEVAVRDGPVVPVLVPAPKPLPSGARTNASPSRETRRTSPSPVKPQERLSPRRDAAGVGGGDDSTMQAEKERIRRLIEAKDREIQLLKKKETKKDKEQQQHKQRTPDLSPSPSPTRKRLSVEHPETTHEKADLGPPGIITTAKKKLSPVVVDEKRQSMTRLGGERSFPPSTRTGDVNNTPVATEAGRDTTVAVHLASEAEEARKRAEEAAAWERRQTEAEVERMKEAERARSDAFAAAEAERAKHRAAEARAAAEAEQAAAEAARLAHEMEAQRRAAAAAAQRRAEEEVARRLAEEKKAARRAAKSRAARLSLALHRWRTHAAAQANARREARIATARAAAAPHPSLRPGGSSAGVSAIMVRDVEDLAASQAATATATAASSRRFAVLRALRERVEKRRCRIWGDTSPLDLPRILASVLAPPPKIHRQQGQASEGKSLWKLLLCSGGAAEEGRTKSGGGVSAVRARSPSAAAAAAWLRTKLAHGAPPAAAAAAAFFFDNNNGDGSDDILSLYSARPWDASAASSDSVKRPLGMNHQGSVFKSPGGAGELLWVCVRDVAPCPPGGGAYESNTGSRAGCTAAMIVIDVVPGGGSSGHHRVSRFGGNPPPPAVAASELERLTAFVESLPSSSTQQKLPLVVLIAGFIETGDTPIRDMPEIERAIRSVLPHFCQDCVQVVALTNTQPVADAKGGGEGGDDDDGDGSMSETGHWDGQLTSALQWAAMRMLPPPRRRAARVADELAAALAPASIALASYAGDLSQSCPNPSPSDCVAAFNSAIDQVHAVIAAAIEANCSAAVDWPPPELEAVGATELPSGWAGNGRATKFDALLDAVRLPSITMSLGVGLEAGAAEMQVAAVLAEVWPEAAQPPGVHTVLARAGVYPDAQQVSWPAIFHVVFAARLQWLQDVDDGDIAYLLCDKPLYTYTPPEPGCNITRERESFGLHEGFAHANEGLSPPPPPTPPSPSPDAVAAAVGPMMVGASSSFIVLRTERKRKHVVEEDSETGFGRRDFKGAPRSDKLGGEEEPNVKHDRDADESAVALHRRLITEATTASDDFQSWLTAAAAAVHPCVVDIKYNTLERPTKGPRLSTPGAVHAAFDPARELLEHKSAEEDKAVERLKQFLQG